VGLAIPGTKRRRLQAGISYRRVSHRRAFHRRASYRRVSHRRASVIGLHLTGVHLTGVYLRRASHRRTSLTSVYRRVQLLNVRVLIFGNFLICAGRHTTVLNGMQWYVLVRPEWFPSLYLWGRQPYMRYCMAAWLCEKGVFGPGIMDASSVQQHHYEHPRRHPPDARTFAGPTPVF
jgi:hypothetical protein